MLPFFALPFLGVLSLLVTVLCSPGIATVKAKAPQLRLREDLPPVAADAGLVNEPLFFDMPIDHFGTSSNNTATFKNRYWMNATYYKPGGPVFLFDSGEQNAEPLLPYYLQEYHGLSAVMRLAARYHGMAILWEHRFYGASLPFPVNRNTTAAQWRFLTTDQALEDVAHFARSFPTAPAPGAPAPALHPSATPWVVVGASYPGVRAALLRIRTPDVVFASWASSAPVHAQVDMASYYAAAQRSMTRNCSADWAAVTRHVDDALAGVNATRAVDVKFALLRARLSGPGGNTTGAAGLTRAEADATSAVVAASILLDPLNFYQYYGFGASVLPFCNLLETRNGTAAPVEDGLAAAHGVDVAFDAFLVALAELDYDSIPGTDDPVTDRSWMWQYCSKYGFYQRGDPSDPRSIETAFESLAFFQQQCNTAFPGAPSAPQVQNVNKYGGWDMAPSNVLFTNGEFDPWRTMGLASIEANSPRRTPSPTVPACGVAVRAPSFFGLTHAGMVHASDMRVLLTPDANHTQFQTVGFYSPISQAPFYAGLALFELALDAWLPCFGKT